MDREKQILEEVDKTLRALDDLPKLDANPFLFTRIRAKLASQTLSERPNWLKHFRLKPIALALIVILNILTALRFLSTSGNGYTEDQLIYSLSKEYNATTTDFMTDHYNGSDKAE